MAFTRKISDIINYPPETLRTYRLIMYEWIDNLNFTLNPKERLNNYSEYISIAKELFLEAGWDGNGEIELMWIPPFMFTGERTEEFCNGIIIWHVKQDEDGLSWILTPIKLPCESEIEQQPIK